MSYDEELAERVRAELRGLGGLTEGRIREGLAFLINGNVALCAYAEGGLLVRVDPDEVDQLARTTTGTRWTKADDPDVGWVRVGSIDVRTTEQLQPWVRRAVGYVSDLPRDESVVGYDLPVRPGDLVRVATEVQWAEVAAARDAASPMPLTRPERERATEPLLRALHGIGALSRASEPDGWSSEQQRSALAGIGSASLDDVVRVLGSMTWRGAIEMGSFDQALADGSFTRVVDRLLAFRPSV